MCTGAGATGAGVGAGADGAGVAGTDTTGADAAGADSAGADAAGAGAGALWWGRGGTGFALKVTSDGIGAAAGKPYGIPARVSWAGSVCGPAAVWGSAWVERIAWPSSKKSTNSTTADSSRERTRRRSMTTGRMRVRALTCSIRIMFMMRDTL